MINDQGFLDTGEIVNPYKADAATETSPTNSSASNQWTVIEPDDREMLTTSLVTQSTGCAQPLAIVFAAILVSASILWTLGDFRSNDHYQDQQQVQPDDKDQQNQDEPISRDDIAGSRLVLVFEKTSPTPDQVTAIREYDVDRVTSLGMVGVYTYDEEDPAARPFIDWANGRGVPTPGMFLLKDRTILRGAAFDDSSDIKEFVGG